MSAHTTFVPSRETVEKIAAALYEKQHPDQSWEDVPAVLKNFILTRALDVLNAAGQFLVRDALHHVGQHADEYGLSDQGDRLRIVAGELDVDLLIASLDTEEPPVR